MINPGTTSDTAMKDAAYTYGRKFLPFILLIFILLTFGCSAEKNDRDNSEAAPGSDIPFDASPKSIAEIKSYLEEHPSDAEAHLQLARQLITKTIDNPKDEKLRDDVKDHLQKAISLTPKDPRAYKELGHFLYAETNEQNSARSELFKKAIELNAQDFESYIDLGHCYKVLNNPDRAESAYNSAVEILLGINSNRNLTAKEEYSLRQAREFLGRVYTDQGKNRLAEKVLIKAVTGLEEYNEKSDEYWGCPYQALGELYSNVGDLERSVEYYKKAADIEYTSAWSQYMAAVKCYDAKDFPCALSYIKRSLAIESSDSSVELKNRILADMANDPNADSNGAVKADIAAAIAFFDHDDFKESMKQLSKSPETTKSFRGMVLKGYLLLYRRDYETAKTLFEKAKKLQPDASGPGVGLGHLDVIQQNYKSAQKKFQKVFQDLKAAKDSSLTPALRVDYKMACLGMGWLLANQNRHPEAISYYNRILEMDPNHLMALLGKGNSLSGMKRLDEAEQLFQRVLKFHPNNQYALAEMAIVRYNRGDNQGAEEAFKAALSVDDQHYTCPYEGLGLIYLRQGKIDQAKKSFEKAIELNPNIEYKKFNGLAKIYMKEGKLEKAGQLLKRSIENYPYDDEAKKLLEQLNKMKSSKDIQLSSE